MSKDQFERKAALVSYMAGLQSIMESKEDAGRERGQTLGREHERCYVELRSIIEEEENEARQRKQQERESKARSNEQGREPGRREPDRDARGETGGGGTSVQREDVPSPYGGNNYPSEGITG